MKMLILADALKALNFSSDTGVRFAKEALLRGWQCYWAELKNITLLCDKVAARVARLPKDFFDAQIESELFWENIELTNFDIILIRKDPPLDDVYISACWILNTLPKTTVVSNSPDIILSHHEKFIPYIAANKGYLDQEDWIVPEVFFSHATFSDWVKQAPEGRYVLKPWKGYAGHGVRRTETLAELEELFTTVTTLDQGWIVQLYRSAVEKTGDRRVFVVNGKVRGSFVRRAQKGSFVTNMAQGGSVDFVEMTQKELRVCEKIASYLKDYGVDIAGLDIIDSKLSEVNITAPTGVKVIKELCGIDIAGEYLDFLEEKSVQ